MWRIYNSLIFYVSILITGGSGREETYGRERIVDDWLSAASSQGVGQLFPFGYPVSTSTQSRRYGLHIERN